MVSFEPGTSRPLAARIHRQLGGQVTTTIPGIGVQVVTVPEGEAMAMDKAYSSYPRVAYAEPDFVVQALGDPDDPYFSRQWGMTIIGAPQAWDVTTGSPSINIAILDTGVDQDHPDLADKIVSNVNLTSSPTADDIRGHGTHVAGIAAATTNNGVGVAGLGYTSTIMNVKVLGDGGAGTYSALVSGIIWAADNGAEIINMSLGGSSYSTTLENAVNYAWSKGVVVVAAAGNAGSSTPCYPAAHPNCIAVAATDGWDALASFSNYGNWVDVAAPGVGIYATLKDSGYGYKSGTSMASPHVAGLAGLVFTTVSDTNGDGRLNDEVRSRIEATCDDIGETGIGHGRINAAQAVGEDAPVLPGSISGQVTDAEDGSAISGAQVTDGTRTTTTDAMGQYTIADVPAGYYEIVASKEGYETSSMTVNVLSGSSAVVNLSLIEIIVPGSIIGSVTDAENGSPIVGATVSDGTRTATTDATGQYTIADVPAGSHEVTASKEGYQSSSMTVNVLSGSSAVANLSLTEAILPGSITGSVADAEDGSPIAGATVSDGTRTTTTDVTGEYTIADVPPGTCQVTARKSGYESASSVATVVSGGKALADFSLTAVSATGSITGLVTDAEDRSPIAGATVSDGTRTTTTDALGRYTIANVPAWRIYQVTASKEGYESSSLRVIVLSGRTTFVRLSLTEITTLPGSITGSVTDAEDRSPIAGATVSDGTRTTTTDTSGEYTIANVPSGTYQVTASKEGYQSSSMTVNVLSGGSAVANLSLTEVVLPGSITGTVTDAENGSPIVGATVSDGTRTTTTDVAGEYTIADVPPGTYQVTASKEGYQSLSMTVNVLSGSSAVANLSLTEVTLPGSITGTVTDAENGSPIVGATVSDGTRTVTTDTSGKYTIADVPPGTYQVTAGQSGYESSMSTVMVVVGGTAMMDFSLNPEPVPVNTMWVNRVRFNRFGSNLFVEVSVVGAIGLVVGADVDLTLACSTGGLWEFSGTTNSAGFVTFYLGKAPVGSYVATVTSLTCSGFTWDTTKGITATSYVLSG
jgi:thermitase